MKEKNHVHLLCVASIDHADYTGGPDDDGDCLDGFADLVGPDQWARLLEGAEPQASDDRSVDGYLIKAWLTDTVTGKLIHHGVWNDLCHDQIERMGVR